MLHHNISALHYTKDEIFATVNSLKGETKKFASKYEMIIHGKEMEVVGFEPTISSIYDISYPLPIELRIKQ